MKDIELKLKCLELTGKLEDAFGVYKWLTEKPKKYTVEGLVAGITRKNRHPDLFEGKRKYTKRSKYWKSGKAGSVVKRKKRKYTKRDAAYWAKAEHAA